jgi:hypothetical protein
MSYLSNYAPLSLFLLQISVLFLLQAFPVLSDAPATQSLYSEDLYKQQRSCAQCCFEGCCCVNDDLVAGGLSCPSPVLNSCYCRGDLQAAAVSYISSCVSSACSSDTVDIQSATSLYQAYCVSNGYPPITTSTSTSTYTPSASQPQATTSTNDLASTAVTSVVIVTQTLVSSSNPSSASPSTGESSYYHHHHHFLLLLLLAALGLGALGLIL